MKVLSTNFVVRTNLMALLFSNLVFLRVHQDIGPNSKCIKYQHIWSTFDHALA
jgi:hypothetical protein